MLDKLRAYSDKLRSGMTPDERRALAASFQDPVARTTDWLPLRLGGANFITHTLCRVSPTRLEVQTSGKAKAFYGVFIGVMGIAWPFALLAALSGSWVGGLLTVMFGLGLLGIFKQLRTRAVFDKSLGYFWSGVGAGPRALRDLQDHPQAIPLSELYALQLVGEQVSRGRGRGYFLSIELNVVRRDGTRAHLTDHDNIDQIRADARLLAAFLDIPIWDGIAPALRNLGQH